MMSRHRTHSAHPADTGPGSCDWGASHNRAAGKRSAAAPGMHERLLSRLLSVPPIQTDTRVHGQRDLEGVNILHLLFYQGGHFLRFVLRRFEDELIVDLKEQLALPSRQL